MAEQSVLLTQFYREYLEWAENGGVQTKFGKADFNRGFGLCHNLEIWLDFHEIHLDTGDNIEEEMQIQFCQAFPEKVDAFCCDFPFNDETDCDGGGRQYENEALSNTCHLNQRRIQWVRDHAA